jgi:tRNA G37 N-methylase Trm5
MSVAYSLFANKVISFEPNPATFEVLEKNSELNPNINHLIMLFQMKKDH